MNKLGNLLKQSMSVVSVTFVALLDVPVAFKCVFMTFGVLF